MDLRRSIYLLSTPALIITILVSFITEITHFTQPIFFALPFLPYVIFAVALVLAYIFNNNREFLLVILITITYWVVNYLIFKTDSTLEITQREHLSHYVTFLLPLNFIIFSFIQERGILSQFGLKQFAIIAIQISVIVIIIEYPISALTEIFNSHYFKQLTHNAVYLSQLSIISFEFSLLVLASLIIHQPSIRQGGIFGCLIFIFISFLNIDNPDAFTLFYAAAGLFLISSIILNSYTLAYHDELTGLSSRRALKQYLMSLGSNYSLAMVDVDHFKSVNDIHGHDVGDQVLRQLSNYLKNAPGGAKAYRYGGEEFTLVYNNKSAADAADHANNLRKQIEKDSFKVRNKLERPTRHKTDKNRNTKNKKEKSSKKKNFKYTVSIGVAEYREQHKTPFDTLKSADKALYVAKKKGRNRVVIAKT